VLQVVGYYTACLFARVLGSIPLLSTRGIWIVVVVLRVLVRPEVVYIVPRGFVLHAGACAFSLRWGQIVTAERDIVVLVNWVACQDARVGLLGQVRPNILTIIDN